MACSNLGKQSTHWADYFFVSDKLKDQQGDTMLLQRSFASTCGGITDAVLVVTPVWTLKSRVIDDTGAARASTVGQLMALQRSFALGGLLACTEAPSQQHCSRGPTKRSDSRACTSPCG